MGKFLEAVFVNLHPGGFLLEARTPGVDRSDGIASEDFLNGTTLPLTAGMPWGGGSGGIPSEAPGKGRGPASVRLPGGIPAGEPGLMRLAALTFLLAAQASCLPNPVSLDWVDPDPDWVDPLPDCLDDTRLLYVHGSYVALQGVENPIRHEGKEFNTLSGWSREPVDVTEFPASRYFWSHKWILRLAVDSTGRMGVGNRTFVIYPGEYPRISSHADEENVRTEIRDEVVFRFEPFNDEWVLVGTPSKESWDRTATHCAEILESLELNE